MARKQTRRSISVRAEVYATLDKACSDNGSSVSAFVEDAVRAKLAAMGVAMVSREEALVYLGKHPTIGRATTMVGLPPQHVEF